MSIIFINLIFINLFLLSILSLLILFLLILLLLILCLLILFVLILFLLISLLLIFLIIIKSRGRGHHHYLHSALLSKLKGEGKKQDFRNPVVLPTTRSNELLPRRWWAYQISTSPGPSWKEGVAKRPCSQCRSESPPSPLRKYEGWL